MEVLIDHSRLNYDLGKLGISADSTCIHEESDETSMHILGQCWALMQSRLMNMGGYLMSDKTLGRTKRPKITVGYTIGWRTILSIAR